jgi:hypothetical protein
MTLVSFRLPIRRSLQRVGRSAALAIVWNIWNVVAMLYLTVKVSEDVRLREILGDSMPRMTNADESSTSDIGSW